MVCKADCFMFSRRESNIFLNSLLFESFKLKQEIARMWIVATHQIKITEHVNGSVDNLDHSSKFLWWSLQGQILEGLQSFFEPWSKTLVTLRDEIDLVSHGVAQLGSCFWSKLHAIHFFGEALGRSNSWNPRLTVYRCWFIFPKKGYGPKLFGYVLQSVSQSIWSGSSTALGSRAATLLIA